MSSSEHETLEAELLRLTQLVERIESSQARTRHEIEQAAEALRRLRHKTDRLKTKPRHECNSNSG